MEDIQKIIPAKDISWSNYPYCSFDDFSNNQDTTHYGNAEMERVEEEYEEEDSEEEHSEEGRCIEIIDVEEDNVVIIGK